MASEINKERGSSFSARNVLLALFLAQIFLLLVYLNITSISAAVPFLDLPSFSGKDDAEEVNKPLVFRPQNAQYARIVKSLLNHTDSIQRFTLGEDDHLNTSTKVAIGMGITSKGLNKGKVPPKSLESKFVFLGSMMPSFCQTASKGYCYTFYMAFDDNDAYFSNSSNLKAFTDAFSKIRFSLCSHLDVVGVVFVKCSHRGRPAWAQNDAMMTAYMDDNDYYYRINDDTKMTSKGWTETYINRLLNYDPPNVGVVGPNHKGGNVGILTYDFVHHSHIDLLGLYYPREFTDWHADNWITNVYKPGRITKIKNITLLHTMSKGTRYRVHKVERPEVEAIIQREKERILSGFKLLAASNVSHSADKVITMSITMVTNDHLYGVVRNALLMRMYFPEWSMQVFVGDENSPWPIPENILKKLEHLDVKVVKVSWSTCSLPPELWPLLAAHDADVEHMIVRHPTQRLSERDASVVKDWVKTGKSLHCVRDHPSQADMAIVPHLWGVKPKSHLFRELLSDPDKPLDLCTYVGGNQTEFLDRLWESLESDSVVHDSIACDTWNNTVPFPTQRQPGDFLGQTFGPCGEQIFDKVTDNVKCKS